MTNAGTTCSICLDSIDERKGKLSALTIAFRVSLPCQHQFHRNCLRPWIDIHSQDLTCPNCRAHVAPDWIIDNYPESPKWIIKDDPKSREESFTRKEIIYVTLTLILFSMGMVLLLSSMGIGQMSLFSFFLAIISLSVSCLFQVLLLCSGPDGNRRIEIFRFQLRRLGVPGAVFLFLLSLIFYLKQH